MNQIPIFNEKIEAIVEKLVTQGDSLTLNNLYNIAKAQQDYETIFYLSCYLQQFQEIIKFEKKSEASYQNEVFTPVFANMLQTQKTQEDKAVQLFEEKMMIFFGPFARDQTKLKVCDRVYISYNFEPCSSKVIELPSSYVFRFSLQFQYSKQEMISKFNSQKKGIFSFKSQDLQKNIFSLDLSPELMLEFQIYDAKNFFFDTKKELLIEILINTQQNFTKIFIDKQQKFYKEINTEGDIQYARFFACDRVNDSSNALLSNCKFHQYFENGINWFDGEGLQNYY